MDSFRAATLAVALCMFFQSTCLAKPPRTTPNTRPASQPSATTQLEQATSFSVTDLAGKYYFGDGLGVNCSLELKGDGKFSFTWRGCLGVYDQNNGPWVLEKGIILLKPTRPNSRDGFRGTATQFFPVRWGEQLYLVADDEIIDFCGALNENWVFNSDRNAFFYLREGDEKKPRTGMPDVPAVYRQYLHEPFKAKVASVLKNKVTVADQGRSASTVQEVIVINQGSKAGVIRGMKFMIEGGDSFGYEVTRVTDDTAECVARGSKTKQGRVKKGAQVSPFLAN